MGGLRDADLCEHRSLGGSPGGDAMAARSWFSNMIAVYVLNRPEDFVELSWISQKLVEMQIDYTTVARPDLTGGGYLEQKSGGVVPENYSLRRAQETAREVYQSVGTITDLMFDAVAHMDVLKTIDEERKKPMALVLTDSTDLSGDLQLRVKRLVMDGAPCDWEAINLKARIPVGQCVSTNLFRVLPDGNEPEERCRYGANLGRSAVLYRTDAVASLSQKLAKVVWDEKRPRCLRTDVALASISDRVGYYAVPSLQEPGLVQPSAFEDFISSQSVQEAPWCSSTTGDFSRVYPCHCGRNVCMTNELCVADQSICKFPPTTSTTTKTTTSTTRTTTTVTTTSTTTETLTATTTTETATFTTTTTSSTKTVTSTTTTSTSTISTTTTATTSTSTRTSSSITTSTTTSTVTTSTATTSTSTRTTTTITRTTTTETTTTTLDGPLGGEFPNLG
jgi:hypothetical protein